MISRIKEIFCRQRRIKTSQTLGERVCAFVTPTHYLNMYGARRAQGGESFEGAQGDIRVRIRERERERAKAGNIEMAL